jgi:hypothetical protein
MFYMVYAKKNLLKSLIFSTKFCVFTHATWQVDFSWNLWASSTWRCTRKILCFKFFSIAKCVEYEFQNKRSMGLHALKYRGATLAGDRFLFPPIPLFCRHLLIPGFLICRCTFNSFFPSFLSLPLNRALAKIKTLTWFEPTSCLRARAHYKSCWPTHELLLLYSLHGKEKKKTSRTPKNTKIKPVKHSTKNPP